jgi:hypothetical protein
VHGEARRPTGGEAPPVTFAARRRSGGSTEHTRREDEDDHEMGWPDSRDTVEAAAAAPATATLAVVTATAGRVRNTIYLAARGLRWNILCDIRGWMHSPDKTC